MSRAPRKNLGRGQYGIYDAGRPKEGQSDEQEDAHLVSRTHMFRPIKYRKQSTELWRTQSEKVRPELRWHARTRGPMNSLVNSNQFADATVVSSYPHQSIVVHAHVYPCWSYRSACARWTPTSSLSDKRPFLRTPHAHPGGILSADGPSRRSSATIFVRSLLQ